MSIPLSDRSVSRPPRRTINGLHCTRIATAAPESDSGDEGARRRERIKNLKCAIREQPELAHVYERIASLVDALVEEFDG